MVGKERVSPSAQDAVSPSSSILPPLSDDQRRRTKAFIKALLQLQDRWNIRATSCGCASSVFLWDTKITPNKNVAVGFGLSVDQQYHYELCE